MCVFKVRKKWGNLGLMASEGSESLTPDENYCTSACLDLENECSHARLDAHGHNTTQLRVAYIMEIKPARGSKSSTVPTSGFSEGSGPALLLLAMAVCVIASGEGGHRFCWRRARNLWWWSGGEV